MSVPLFDQTARYAATRLDAVGFLSWLLPTLFTQRKWGGWRDARTIIFPGESERTCDTIAEFHALDGTLPPLAAVVEFERVPRAVLLERLAEYVLRFRRELLFEENPRTPYDVIGVVLYLMGSEQPAQWVMQPPELPGAEFRFGCVSLSVATLSASATLTAIEEQRLSRAVLPWISLMQGADQLAIVERWKALGEMGTDQEQRTILGGLATTFAHLPKRHELWEKVLEDWKVEDFEVVQEFMKKGEIRGEMRKAQNDLRLLLELRFGSALPAEAINLYTRTTDFQKLDQWFRIAATSANAEEFSRAAGTILESK